MAEKAGFLTKEGGSYKSWKRRWCVLKTGNLIYSKSQKGEQLGTIPLVEATSIEVTNTKNKKCCFEIVTAKRTYYLCADSDAEKDSWVKELKSEMNRIQGKAKTSKESSEVEKKVVLEDFELLNVIGKGSFGKVIQVRKKDNGRIYAMKVLNKDMIVQRQELNHAKAEKNVLQKLVHPFLVNLNYSFQTPDKLYFVMDYVNGGELFYHLQKDKRFSEDRARFYLAEIALGLEYLHANGVLYRDLKPENLLLTADGHICLTDFGLAKEGLICEDSRTSTFCGTPEYLAPEVLDAKDYGLPVDWWSYGTLMYEMLTGLPPFYCEEVQKMYQKIMTAPLNIPSFFSPEAKNLVERLLDRSPVTRLADPAQVKAHPFFKSIDWEKLFNKEITPPFIPPVKNAESTAMVDKSFLSEPVTLSPTESNLSNLPNIENFTYSAESAISRS